MRDTFELSVVCFSRTYVGFQRITASHEGEGDAIKSTRTFFSIGGVDFKLK